MKTSSVAMAVVALSALGCSRHTDHAAAGYEALSHGNNTEAVTELRAAVNERPNAAELHFDLGIAYERAGWEPEALAEYELALKLDPHDATFRNGLAETKRTLGYRALMQGKHADAARLCQESLVVQPDDPITWYNLSVALTKLDRADEAAKALERAAELDPQHYGAKPKGS